MSKRLETYKARAAAMTARERAAMSDIAAGALLCAMAPSAALLAVVLGFSLPMSSTAEQTFQAVQVDGSESDIIDYNLTFDDCLRLSQDNRADDINVFCERESK